MMQQEQVQQKVQVGEEEGGEVQPKLMKIQPELMELAMDLEQVQPVGCHAVSLLYFSPCVLMVQRSRQRTGS